MNQLASDLNDSNNNESSTSESSNQSTSQQTTNNTTSQTAQEDQATSNKDRQQSEDVLDALLDKYSDKAQQTHKDYTSSKKTAHLKHHKMKIQKDTSTTQDQLDTNKDNPQLPTEKQLKHKQEAPQSFENDFKQK